MIPEKSEFIFWYFCHFIFFLLSWKLKNWKYYFYDLRRGCFEVWIFKNWDRQYFRKIDRSFNLFWYFSLEPDKHLSYIYYLLFDIMFLDMEPSLKKTLTKKMLILCPSIQVAKKTYTINIKSMTLIYYITFFFRLYKI